MRRSQGLKTVARLCIAERCAVRGAVSASLVEDTRCGVMHYACDSAYCGSSRAVIRSVALAAAPLTTYWCKSMQWRQHEQLLRIIARLPTRRNIQHPRTPERYITTQSTATHHNIISATNSDCISKSSNATPISFLPTRSPNLPSSPHNLNRPPRPSSSTQAFSHSSQASMPIPLTMLTENTEHKTQNTKEKKALMPFLQCFQPSH